MKRQTYLDFISELLPEQDFLNFQKFYKERVKKSIKIIYYRIEKKSNLEYLKGNNWNIIEPDLTTNKKPINDVLFIEKEDKQTLWANFLHQTWFYYVQEMAAGASAQMLPLEKNDLILDLCAAPWWKTVQLADKLLNLWRWNVIANEPSNQRRKVLIYNLNNTWVTGYDGTFLWDMLPEEFDKVLVDAPCSWEWMQYKNDKTVNFRDEKSAEKLSKLQFQLLESWLKALKINWTIVYSTCTLNPLENEWVISRILEKYNDEVILENVEIDQKSIGIKEYKWKELLSEENMQKVARFWPHIQHTGGFFIAKIKKIKSIPYGKTVDKRIEKKWILDTSADLQNRVRKYLNENRWIEKLEGFKFIASDQAVYVTSENFEIPKVFIEKIWIPIIKISFSKERIPQQWLATIFWSYAKFNTVTLTDKELQIIIDKYQIEKKVEKKNIPFIIWKRLEKGCIMLKQTWDILKWKL